MLYQVIQTSSKYLLATTYSRSIKSPFQLLDRLQFVVHGTHHEFYQTMTGRQLDKVKQAITRYLLGTGHPFPGRVADFVSDETLRRDQQDPLFRTRRFVKVTSGLPTFPLDNRKFKV